MVSVVVVTLSSQRREICAPVPLYLAMRFPLWISGLSRLGPSVKSRMLRTLPRMASESSAVSLKERTPSTPTTGLRERDDALRLYTGPSGVPSVELTISMARLPFLPSCGWKNVQMPLLPAGQATMSRGPMMLRLLSGSGLVTTACASTLQSE